MQPVPQKESLYSSGLAEPLMAHQRYMLNYQLCFPECMLNNIPALVRFPKGSTDPEKLCAACERAFRMHPSFSLVHSFDETGNIVLQYRPDIIEKIPIIDIKEHEFLGDTRSLVRPFSLMDSRLYHCEIYAGERNTYLFLDTYHTLSDGNSLMITLRDIFAVMNKEDCKPDAYLDYLSECGKRQQMAEAAYPPIRDEENYASVPRFDRKGQADQRSACVKQFGMTQQDWEAAAKKRGTTPNQSLVAACLAALSAYNREKNVMVNWTFHGRDTEEKRNMTGLLIGNLPVVAMIEPGMTIRELLDKVRDQCQKWKKYVWLSPGVQGNRPGENDRIAVLYQNFLSIPSNVPKGSSVSYLFDALTGQVNCFNIIADKKEDPQERAEVLFVCNLRYYDPGTLERFSEIFCRFLRRILLTEDNSSVLELVK